MPGKMLRFFTVLAFVAPAFSPAEPIGLYPSSSEEQAKALVAEIETYRSLSALELTHEQRSAIAPIIREHVSDLEALERAKRESEAGVLAAMRVLRSAVLANQGVAEEIKKGVREAEESYKVIEQRLENAAPGRAARLWSTLAPSQRGILSNPRIEPRRYHSRKRPMAFRPVALGDATPSRDVERSIVRNLLTPQALTFTESGTASRPATFQFSPALSSAIADVRVMNLVNSLNLSVEQMRALMEISSRARPDVAALEKKRDDLARQATPNLEILRDAYANDRVPEEPLRRALGFYLRENRRLREEGRSFDERHLPAVKALLAANQIDMAANFVPCVVPIQSLTNPERVGQADNASGIERALARARALPESRAPETIERVKKRVEEAFKRRKHREEEIALVLARVPDVVARARAMDDAEFEVKKGELAREIAVPEKPKAEGDALNRRIVDYLLSPNLLPILDERCKAASRQ